MKPVFEHRHADVHDVYYQSVGVLSHSAAAGRETTVYRMMFSGSTTAGDAWLPRRRLHLHPRRRRADRDADGADAPLPADHPRPGDAVHLQGRPLRDRPRRQPPGVPASLKIFEITAHRSGGADDHLRGPGRLRVRRRQGRLQLRRPPGGVPHQQARLPDAHSSTAASRRRRSPTWSSPTWPATRAARSPASPACRGSPPRPPKASAITSRRSCPTARCSTSRTLVPKQSPEPKRFRLTVVDPAQRAPRDRACSRRRPGARPPTPSASCGGRAARRR